MYDYILFVYVCLVLQMCIVWFLYRWTSNPSIVDVTWSLGLMMAGLIYLSSAETTTISHVVLGCLLVLWSARLAGYLWYSRIKKGHIDKRYTQLSQQWKMAKSLGFFINFQLQAILMLIISIVFFFAAQVTTEGLSDFNILACVVIVIGIIGETVADYQLQGFKLSHQGQVCDVGLWRYSRHPNYFFDWVTWCGFAMFGLSASLGCIGLVSPLLLYIIFTRITGPMTEQGSIQSRGQAFLDYQKKTSMFFPWFKR